MSQTEMGAAIDLDTQAIEKIETGTRVLTLSQAWKIGEAMEVDIWTLFGSFFDGF